MSTTELYLQTGWASVHLYHATMYSQNSTVFGQTLSHLVELNIHCLHRFK